ncbi:TetR family transcriptional regulator [Mycolicibacterium acapulense]|uniref:TetR family transcriptional regulator n=1 Tax=Mycobacterium lehmannii TaxID=2048550 RepID=A0A101A607_9MYCO|nr:TetR family transcriptional regulator [Mycolicibacterium acapulense]KUI08218.1 TetR family transcriptional regulator [Mycolicibacterium acapulense]KUI14678.1 TetR family transcriptional regulator [Mycobacterium lehmannii]
MARVSGAREHLVETGIRILERDGLAALSARKLAAETGTSTMAVYTHFGGMSGLIDAIAGESFARFTRALTEVTPTEDPVADFFVMGARYREFALQNPQRYQMMFGTAAESLNRYHADLTVTGSASARSEWAVSFDALLTGVRRMIEAGRIRDDGEAAVAGRLWSISHGAVLLEIAGFFGHEGHGLTQILGPLTVDTLVGLGDERDRTMASLTTAMTTLLGP